MATERIVGGDTHGKSGFPSLEVAGVQERQLQSSIAKLQAKLKSVNGREKVQMSKEAWSSMKFGLKRQISRLVNLSTVDTPADSEAAPTRSISKLDTSHVKETWLQNYNFCSLPLLVFDIARFGSIHGYFEGGYIGEKFLILPKKSCQVMRESPDFCANLMENVQVQRTVDVLFGDDKEKNLGKSAEEETVERREASSAQDWIDYLSGETNGSSMFGGEETTSTIPNSNGDMVPMREKTE